MVSTLIAAALISCTLGGVHEPHDPVPFEMDAAGRILVPVTVNGDGPFTFLLDSGATHSLVSPDLAARLRLPEVGSGSIAALGRSRRVPVVAVEVVSIGPLIAGRRAAAVATVEAVGDRRIDGVLGQDVLAKANYIVDFSTRSLWLSPAVPLSWTLEGTRIPFRRVGRRLVLTVRPGAGTKNLDVVLDTGAAELVLFDVAALPVAPLMGGAIVRTPVGLHRTRTGRLSALTVGSTVLRDIPVHVADGGERREHGLLPMRLFDAVYVNNFEEYVIVNPESLRVGHQPARGDSPLHQFSCASDGSESISPGLKPGAAHSP